ncbi:MAG: hypothetical protein A2428_01875 [Bdellovibrionales bacterium RIFOXYC1_FULL_54_43]|nr:MAG: hypothetical protein A2428_01875 [Bdellovibrionales bacterium RIFOXYC1_FULL_54_43]OFZ81688.1 MAG: hypothetical protein A2603_12085 [Bdellovibrionales bacterium RIFOXYD1_FULL_55_31]
MSHITDEAIPMDKRIVILSVDDDPVSRVLVEKTFGQRFTVLSAENGAQAIRILENVWPDLVLLDIMLPDMAGYDVIERVHGISSEIPVLFITGLKSPEDVRKGFDAGAADYIIKPFNLVEMEARVNAHLRSSHYTRLIRDAARVETMRAMLVSLKHEINNPLAIILAHVSSAPSSERGREWVVGIERQVHRISDLLKRLGELEKIDFKRYVGSSSMLKLN